MTLTGTATSQISVSGIRVNPANVEWDSSLYRGPAFHELDPDLQVSSPIKRARVQPSHCLFSCTDVPPVFRDGYELFCYLGVRVSIAGATVAVDERRPKERPAVLYSWVRREQTNASRSST